MGALRVIGGHGEAHELALPRRRGHTTAPKSLPMPAVIAMANAGSRLCRGIVTCITLADRPRIYT